MSIYTVYAFYDVYTGTFLLLFVTRYSICSVCFL